ncbi:MAG: leucine-rich repeat domain-containing protein [Chlamydiales bacterium]|nr:leucine-rich repeat domain-containing protein [Chlamydiales bacterium]
MESWLNRTGLIHLTELDLSNLALALALPPIVAKFTNLKKLNLNGNFLRSFPNEFEALTQLEHLSLCGNSLEGIPWQLTKLPQLKSLDISGSHEVINVENALEIESLKELVADNVDLQLSSPYGSEILHKLCHKLTRISVKGDRLVGDQATDLVHLKNFSLRGKDFKCEECLRVDALPPA